MPQRTRRATEMLNDVSSETAQQLFNAVRYQTDPPGSTMLPELDSYILASVPSLQSSLNRGDVVEIQGPAASGKTQLLYHLAANCILPAKVSSNSPQSYPDHTTHVGGWHNSAVVLDCDGRWDTRRLYTILITRLSLAFSSTQIPPSREVDITVSSIALESLSRLHVFRPASSSQLAATLLHLPKYHADQMPAEEVALLLVDSISSFYWPDRWQAEPSGPKKLHKPNPLRHVLQCLQAFRKSHGPVTVLTNWGLNPLSSTTSASPVPFFKQHLVSPFPAPLDEPPRQLAPGEPNPLPLTCHITIPFAFVSPLQPDFSHLDNLAASGLEEALRDERRKGVVQRGEIGAYVRIPRTGHGQDVAPRSSVGRFKLRVLERNVIAQST